MWNGIRDIVAEIKRCESAGATMAAVTMAYVCIDTMAFLSMPSSQSSQTGTDFITWVDSYLKGHPYQPYQYVGIDVYAARCGVLHAFGAEANLHRNDTSIKKFGYHNGGLHAFRPAVSPNRVIIGTASFLNDVVIAVETFLNECENNIDLRSRVEARLPSVFARMPFSHSASTGP